MERGSLTAQVGTPPAAELTLTRAARAMIAEVRMVRGSGWAVLVVVVEVAVARK